MSIFRIFGQGRRPAREERTHVGDADPVATSGASDDSRSPASASREADIRILLAEALLNARRGDIPKATLQFDQVLSLRPDCVDAIEGRAELFDSTGRIDEARREYERARRLRATTRSGPPDRSYALRQRGTFDSQISAYSVVLSCVKDSAQPLVARGNAYLAHGQADLALVDYERALRIKPRVPEVMALKGEALAILGRHREALEIFDAALVKRPTDPEILNGRGVVRMALGMADEANSDWRRQMEALGIDAASARACVALRMADYPAALPALDRALAKEPRDLYWILYRLTALSRLGKPIVPSNLPRDDVWPAPMIALYGGSDTEQQVLGSVDTNNRRAEALFQLGVLALGRGEHGEAIRRWNEVVAHADVDLIEYAAARNELMRLGVKGQT